jgi:hypothetical protein
MFNTLVDITCCHDSCHVHFGMSQGHYELCKADSGKWFYCSNGHKQHFSDSETDQLRRERDRLKQTVARLEEYNQNKNERIGALEKSNAATRGVVTRIKNRVSNGVCPCCNRTFTNLHNHMAAKHPNYRKEDAA